MTETIGQRTKTYNILLETDWKCELTEDAVRRYQGYDNFTLLKDEDWTQALEKWLKQQIANAHLYVNRVSYEEAKEDENTMQSV